ncbi:uncharacterized protein LOC114804137 [Zeugodacus cucurbitae]|uniref:uncharacterized protein LOC114804137 n=1 Tax=Zeugodacus cucurbitae TaxID=28588 RepID=UPI0023D90AA1|nr:uncharacterized protein LOC114804137 [Zeugodacus cucurbitae]
MFYDNLDKNINLAFCQAHPEITSRKNWPNKTQQMRDLWQQLREELNCCRGPKRNVAKWKEMLCVWKSQLHARARRLKINQRLTDGVPSLKPMSDFEKKALTTFASAAAMSIERFYLKTHDYLTVERTTSPTGTASCSGSPRALCSPLVIPSNNGQSAISLNSEPSAPSPCPSVDLENQDASTSRLSRSERNELINTLIADIAKRYGAEERQRIENDRRQEHRE